MIRFPTVALALSVPLQVLACTSGDGGGQKTAYVTCGEAGTCPHGYTCSENVCVHTGTELVIDNPTGDCRGEAGVRPGYAVPERGTVWLPDCKNPLKREYWRVYAVTPHSAYVLPRPDGAYQLDGVCNTDDDPLRPLVDRYSLCSPAATPEDVDVVNDIRPADALKLTHFLHTQLHFEPTEGIPNTYLRPFAIPGDVIDACALHPDARSAELASDCDAEQRYVDTGVEPVPDFASTAAEMAALLNELYGIQN